MLCHTCITCLVSYLTLTAKPWLQQRNEWPAKSRHAVISQLLYQRKDLQGGQAT